MKRRPLVRSHLDCQALVRAAADRGAHYREVSPLVTLCGLGG